MVKISKALTKADGAERMADNKGGARLGGVGTKGRYQPWGVAGVIHFELLRQLCPQHTGRQSHPESLSSEIKPW